MNRLDPRKRSNLIPKGEKGLCRWCSKPVPQGRRSWCSQECVDDALIRTQPSYARRKVEERDKGVCAECGIDTRELENHLRRLGALARSGVDAYDRTRTRAARRYGMDVNRLWKVIEAEVTDFEQAKHEARDAEREAQGLTALRPYRGRTKPLAVTVAEQRVREINRRLKRMCEARLKRMTSEMIRQGFDGIGRFGVVNRSLWDADHILPVVKGGGGCGLENYRTLCQPCHKAYTKRLAAERAAARQAETKGPQHPELNLS